MTNQKIIRIFKKFLKKHDVYGEYCAEMKSRCDDIYKRLLGMPNAHSFTGEPFSWDETEMGSDYWQEIDAEWIRFLLNYHHKP